MVFKNWKKVSDIAASFRGLSFVGMSDIISSAISSIFWLYMASIMGADSYGQISYLLAIAGISSTLASLGVQNTITVYTAKNIAIQPPLYLITLVSSCITALVVFFIFNNYSMSLYVIAVVISGLAIAEILGRRNYKNYAKYIIIQKILMVVLAIIFYYIIGINGVIIGIAISFLVYSIKIYQAFRSSKIEFSLVKPRFSFMLNTYVVDVLSAFNGSVDKIIIAPILGFSSLGNYQLGIQFLAIAYVLPNIISKYLIPEDASGYSNKKLKKVVIGISVLLSVLGILLSPLVVPILFPKFSDAVQVIQITSMALVPYTISAIYASKLLGMEKARIVLYGSIVYSIVQILTLLTIGQIFGINGMATSYVLSTTSMSIFYYIITKKKNLKID